MALTAASPPQNPPPLAGFLRWVDRCNASPADLAPMVPWLIAGHDVGLLRPALARRLAAEHGGVFVLEEGGDQHRPGTPPTLRLTPAQDAGTPAARTAAIGSVLASLRDDGTITGWRDELYPVAPAFTAPPLALVERAAAAHLGIRAYGVHVNGWVRTGRDGGPANADPASSGISLWVARRAADKPTWPGKLDHLAAGGQPAGVGVTDNVMKECGEEAGIPPTLAAAARPVGVVSYASLQAAGPKRDVLFVYDLELPPSFQPVPTDGEVAGFELLPLSDVAARVAGTDDFKDNCNLVITDFLVRRGFLVPEQEGYLELVGGLRKGAVV